MDGPNENDEEEKTKKGKTKSVSSPDVHALMVTHSAFFHVTLIQNLRSFSLNITENFTMGEEKNLCKFCNIFLL